MKKDAAVRAAVLDALRALPGIAQAYTADEIMAAGSAHPRIRSNGRRRSATILVEAAI